MWVILNNTVKTRSRLGVIMNQKDVEERIVLSHLVEKLKHNSNPKSN